MTEFLDDTVLIKTATYTGGDEGEPIATLSSGTSAACYVRDARGSRLIDQGREGSAATHIVYFATDPSVKQGDILAWGSRNLVVQGQADRVSDVMSSEEYWSVLARERA